jgi:EmrB/QacA subfamily drug resistance transporter
MASNMQPHTSAGRAVGSDMEPSARSPWLLPVLFVGVFMVILDVFVVMVAAPSLAADLHASASEIQWVVAAYLLAYAMTLITGGRLGDIVGRRRMLRAGFVVFSAASALCAAAPTPTALIAARVLQGLGSAAMWPQVLSIVQVEFAPPERPRAFALQGMVQGFASIAGQIVGGGLISLDLLGLGWRWVFLVNVPVGVVAVAAAGRVVPESRSPAAHRLDLPGVALATLALGLLMFPIVQGRELGWPWWTAALLAGAAPVGAAFLAWERRVVAGGRSPLLDLRLFVQRGFRIGVAAAVALFVVPSFFLFLALYLQEGGGASPIESGVAFVPLATAYVAASLLGPRVGAARMDALPVAGGVVIAAGMGTTIAALAIAGPSFLAGLIVVAVIPVGIGMGLSVPPLIGLVLRSVATDDAGAASGTLVTAQQVGNALGVAVVGAVFFGRLGGGSGPGAYGGAFEAAAAVQGGLALVAAALVSRTRARETASAPGRAGGCRGGGEAALTSAATPG